MLNEQRGFLKKMQAGVCLDENLISFDNISDMVTNLELTGNSEFNTHEGMENCSRNNFNLKKKTIIIHY